MLGQEISPGNDFLSRCQAECLPVGSAEVKIAYGGSPTTARQNDVVGQISWANWALNPVEVWCQTVTPPPGSEEKSRFPFTSPARHQLALGQATALNGIGAAKGGLTSTVTGADHPMGTMLLTAAAPVVACANEVLKSATVPASRPGTDSQVRLLPEPGVRVVASARCRFLANRRISRGLGCRLNRAVSP